ncbi:hypothetical protein LCGC14_2036200, partial [marine sediment metagenome]
MNYEEMRAMEQTHVCAQCGGRLSTKWDPGKSFYRLGCGRDPNHQGFSRIPSAEEELQRGLAPASNMSKEDHRVFEGQFEQRIGPSLLPKADLETGQALEQGQLQGLIAWAEVVSLRPYLGHVAIMRGKPYVTIDGYYYLARRRGRSLSIGVRPAT